MAEERDLGHSVGPLPVVRSPLPTTGMRRRAEFLPPHAVAPGPGQESVWDYPRPPRVEASTRLVEVYFGGIRLAETRRSMRVLETSHPPVYYVPPEDVRMELLVASDQRSWCEWKGLASYYHVVALARPGHAGRRAENAAWYYPDPTVPYKEIRGAIAFYPGAMDACLVDGEAVVAQPGGFYGGWITRDVVGPFKGEPGSSHW
jgi:uncharacterized protein (DUF427 family)